MGDIGTVAYRALRQRTLRQFLADATTEIVERLVVPRLDPWFAVQTLNERALSVVCSKEGTFFEHYGAPESYVLDLPTTPNGYDPEEQVYMEDIYCSGMKIDAPFVCELTDVDLLGPDAVPVKNGGYVAENFFYSTELVSMGCLRAISRGMFPSRASDLEPDSSVGTVVSLVGPWNYNYTHWFQDYLTRLEGMEYYQHVTGVEPDLLVPADASAWMLDALRAVGIDEDRLIDWPGGHVRAERLIVPAVRREERGYSPNRRILYSPSGVEWVSERIRQHIEPERTVPHSSRIYLSREGALKRRVVNEDDVMALLSDWGFERYRPEELSFAEQVTLFSNAEAIVSPHGSGLMNQIFADDAAVIELMGQKQTITSPATEYFYAELLGHDYACVPGEAVGADLRTDVSGLETILEKLLGNP